MKVFRFAVVLAVVFAACFACADFDRFQAYIGIDDGAKGRPGDGIFRVQVDGKEVFKSEVLRPGSPVVKLDIPIAGAKELKLFIDDEGNGHGGDWGEWLDARMVDSKSGEFVFLTDLQPEEKAWIGACRDRNVIRQPLRVNGVTYLRGWGCISGSELSFKGWDKAVADAEAKVDAEEASAEKNLGKPKLRMGTGSPKWATLDEKGGNSSMDVDLADPSASTWLKTKVFVKFGKREFPLIDLIQPTERVLHRYVTPNRSVLTGGPTPQNAFLAGAPWPAKKVGISLKDLALAATRLPQAATKVGGKLIVKVKPFRTNEVADPAAVTSALCKIVADGHEIGDILSDDSATYQQEIPLAKWPERLECVATPGADGSLADSFVLDLGLQLEGMKEPLWLHTVDPSFQKFEYGQPDKMIAGESWRIPGLGLVRWLGLQSVLKAREAGLAELDKVRKALEVMRKKEEVDEAVARVVAIDPGQPEIRLAAAARFRDWLPMEERRQLGLLLETSRVDLKTAQEARKRIDAIWREKLVVPVPLPDSPKVIEGGLTISLFGGPLNKSLLIPEGSGIGLGQLAAFTIGPSNGWTRELKLRPGDEGDIGWMVNSNGVECSLRVYLGDKLLAEKSGRYPWLVLKREAIGRNKESELRGVVTVDPDGTGILLDHQVSTFAWQADKPDPVQPAKWQIHLLRDGSALVTCVASSPVIAAIPRTATGLTVSKGAYLLSEPVTEYLVQPDPKLGGSNVVLFAVPAGPTSDSPLGGGQMVITYTWPDAAYNVPMSHFDWDRLGRVYMQTPAALLDTDAKTTWTVSWFPPEWKLQTSTPAPSDKSKLVFEVEPQAGLTVVWNAKDVLTPWIAMKHKNLTMYIPDNPNNRYWFPLWMSYVRQVYDKQVENTGFEKPNYLYIGVQGASMLSGYGGGTAGDDHTSETWLPATGRCSPYFWMHNPNPSGVDSHELHWVAFGCFVEGLPVWVMNGFGGWIEETGWRCTDLAGCEEIMRSHLKNAAAALEQIRADGKNPMQSTQEEWDALPGPTREKMISLGWFISEELSKAYGKGFWAKFWTEQRAKNAEAYKKLSAHQKDVFFVNELVRISGDAKLKGRFEKEWGFNLAP